VPNVCVKREEKEKDLILRVCYMKKHYLY